MAEVLPISNKVVKLRLVFNSDEMGWKNIWDIQAAFSSIGVCDIFVDSTANQNPEIVMTFKRRLPEVKPQTPSKTATEQMDKLKDDIKKESR